MMSEKKLLNDKSLDMNVVISRKTLMIFSKVSSEPESERKICKLTVWAREMVKRQ